MGETVHIDVVRGLIKKACEFIDQAITLLETKIIVASISVPTKEIPKAKRRYRRKPTESSPDSQQT